MRFGENTIFPTPGFILPWSKALRRESIMKGLCLQGMSMIFFKTALTNQPKHMAEEKELDVSAHA